MGSPGSPGCLAAGRDTAAKHHLGGESECGRNGGMEVVSVAFKKLVVLNSELLFSAV